MHTAAAIGAVAPHNAVGQRTAIYSHRIGILPDCVHHHIAVHQGVRPTADNDGIVGMVVVDEAILKHRRSVGKYEGASSVVHNAATHEGVFVGIDNAVVG